MTSNERAGNCGLSFYLSRYAPKEALQCVRDEIARQIREACAEAVAEEREACARVVEKTACLIMPTAEVAARIRARATPPEQP